MNRRDHISKQPGLCVFLAYTPPAELGQGAQIPAWGKGGFSIRDNSRPSGDTAPRQRGGSGPRLLSVQEARNVADFIDTFFDFEDRQTGGIGYESCRGWVEAILGDLPAALYEAIEQANKRTDELIQMRVEVVQAVMP